MITQEEKDFIIKAKKYLEDPSFIMKIVNLAGEPIEMAAKALPKKVQSTVTSATTKSLNKALDITLHTMGKPLPKDTLSFSENLRKSRKGHWAHVSGSAATGAIGGFFGVISLPIELPITTGIMLRSIAQSADTFGFNLGDPAIKTECLYVFTLGSDSKDNDSMESSYYTSRVGFEQFMKQASKYLAEHSAKHVLEGIKKGTAPIIIEFIAAIAARFEIAVTEKLLLEIVPVVGALGGASVNAAFTNHFSSAGYYHFGLRSLEEKYGKKTIQSLYGS